MAVQRMRPRIENEATMPLSFRITAKEHKKLKALCKEKGITISMFMDNLLKPHLKEDR